MLNIVAILNEQNQYLLYRMQINWMLSPTTYPFSRKRIKERKKKNNKVRFSPEIELFLGNIKKKEKKKKTIAASIIDSVSIWLKKLGKSFYQNHCESLIESCKCYKYW